MRLETIDIEGKSFFGIAMPYDTDLIAKAKNSKEGGTRKESFGYFQLHLSEKKSLLEPSICRARISQKH